MRIFALIVIIALYVYEYAIQGSLINWYDWAILIIGIVASILFIVSEASEEIDGWYYFSHAIIAPLLIGGLIYKCIILTSSYTTLSFNIIMPMILIFGLYVMFNYPYYISALILATIFHTVIFIFPWIEWVSLVTLIITTILTIIQWGVLLNQGDIENEYSKLKNDHNKLESKYQSAKDILKQEINKNVTSKKSWWNF